MKDVLIHIAFSSVHCYQNMLNMANSVESDETPRLVWVNAICKCPLFGCFFSINALTRSPQLRTLNFRLATPLLDSFSLPTSLLCKTALVPMERTMKVLEVIFYFDTLISKC